MRMVKFLHALGIKYGVAIENAEGHRPLRDLEQWRIISINSHVAKHVIKKAVFVARVNWRLSRIFTAMMI